MSINKMKEWESSGKKISVTAVGNKGLGFMSRIGASVSSHIVGLGDTPHMERLIGPIKVMLDAYVNGEVDVVYICFTRFINTMKQEAVVEQLLPLSADFAGKAAPQSSHANDKVTASDVVESVMQMGVATGHWDYIYEPEAKELIEELMVRYVESLVFHAVAENMASEQSARMVAMKAASDNAKNVIGELKLVYNKARQAAITKEISEIVGGAAAV